MFKIKAHLTSVEKSKKPGKCIIKGIASDTSVDKDGERFTEKAIKGMLKSVTSSDLPIRIEHEDKFYTEVGVWQKATMNKSNQIEVTGEVDTELSLGNDIAVLLKRGADIALSIGGFVKSAYMEVDGETGKSVKVYDEMMLTEISVVKNPSNNNADLRISKSVNWEALKKSAIVTSTKEAQEMNKANKGFQRVAPEKFTDSVIEYSCIKKSHDTNKVKEEITLEAFGKSIAKCCELSAPSEEVSHHLSHSEFEVILSIIELSQKIDIPKGEKPKDYEDTRWGDMVDDTQFIMTPSMRKVILYRDTDYKVREDWLNWGIYQLFAGNFYLTPKEFNIVLKQVYAVLISLTNEGTKPKALKKSYDVSKVKDANAFLQECYYFKKGFTVKRPQIDGNDLSDEEIAKCSIAHTNVMYKAIQGSTQGDRMRKTNSLTTNNMPAETKKAEEVVETKEEVVKTEEEVVETKEEVAKTEEVVEPKEDVKKTEEETVEPTKEEVVKTEEVEPKKEDVKKTEEVPETVEETPSNSDTPVVEATKSDTPEVVDIIKSVEALAGVVKSLSDGLPKLVKDTVTPMLEEHQKSVSKSAKTDSTELVKALKDSFSQGQDELAEKVKTQSEDLGKTLDLITKMAEAPAQRRSLAFQTVEKATATGDQSIESRTHTLLAENPNMDFKEARSLASKQ